MDGVVSFDTQRPTLFIEMFQKAINPTYVDIMLKARTAAQKDVQNPALLPAVGSRPGLAVQGLVLAKNSLFTAQLHGLAYIAIHKNNELQDSLEPGVLAVVTYNENSIAHVNCVGKPIEFAHPGMSTLHIEQAKPVTKVDTLYHGKFIYADKDYFYQELGRNNILKHEKRLFSQDEQPNLGDSLTIKYDKGKPQLVSHHPSENSFTPEEETTFIDTILHYKQLKSEKEKCPYPSIKPLLAEKLVSHVREMMNDKKLMHYIKAHFPKMAQNMKSLSQSRSLSIGIER